MKLPSHWWWDLSTQNFADLDMSQIVAVLPVAAVEQHGPHLPVRVDSAINEGVIRAAVARMTDDFPALVLPMLPIGKSEEHLAFPGTLTLNYDTLARLWFEVAQSVHRAGVRKILFVNTHGGQPQIMEITCRRLRIELGMFAVSSSPWGFSNASDLFDVEERTHGIHAGEAETSVMLHLHPELVDMSCAENFVPTTVALSRSNGMLTAEGAIGFGWQTQDLHPSGACGNASAADAARGAIVVERAATGLLSLIEEIARYPMDRLVATTRYTRT